MALDLAPLPMPAGERGRHLLHLDMMYYSLITQCSVGYGDLLPRGAATDQAAAGGIRYSVTANTA